MQLKEIELNNFRSFSKGRRPTYPEDLECCPERVWKVFNKLGVKGLSNMNGLSIRDNARLFETEIMEEAIELVLAGITKSM